MGFYAKREGYKKPDVHAPRFRRKWLNILTTDLFKKFQEKNPSIDIDYKTYKSIILSFNRKIREKVLEHRDGVELPEQLGYIFIGTCPKATKPPIDAVLSSEYDKKISFKNWESNQYLAKIFYSNYGTKYRFSNRNLWYFIPSRKFKRSLSSIYADNWNRFIKVSPISKVSNFFRSQNIKSIKVKKHDYNNRRMDFSDTQPD